MASILPARGFWHLITPWAPVPAIINTLFIVLSLSNMVRSRILGLTHLSLAQLHRPWPLTSGVHCKCKDVLYYKENYTSHARWVWQTCWLIVQYFQLQKPFVSKAAVSGRWRNSPDVWGHVRVEGRGAGIVWQFNPFPMGAPMYGQEGALAPLEM